MKTVITSGLKGQEAAIVREEYLSSPSLRKRLVELLIKKQEHSYNERISKSAYDNPNWSLLQADQVGYERAMKEVISLLVNNEDN